MATLEEVTQRFVADVRPYVDAMAVAAAAADLFAKANQDATDSVAVLAATADMAAQAIQNQAQAAAGAVAANSLLSGSAARAAQASTVNAAAAAAAAQAIQNQAQAAAAAAAANNAAAGAAARAGRMAAAQAAAANLAAAAVARQAQAAAAGVPANAALGAANVAAAAAGNQANGVWRAQIGWLRLTRTAIHWIVAGSAEFLAVAVPAAVALGAAMLVAMQGAQMLQIHMSSLYTATEATANIFHTTFGQALGLKSSLQQAQDAANPIVWSVLGAALTVVKKNFQNLAGSGLQVMRIFQDFSARVVADFQAGFGKEVQGLLAGMVTSLTQFGQVLGNLGHALINFAAAMPGLAHVLLATLAGATKLIELFSALPRPIIFSAMALEEFYRWGGVVMTMLVRLTGQMAIMKAIGWTGFITQFGAAFATLARLGALALIQMGLLIGRFAGMSAAAGTVGTAIATVGARIGGFIASLSALQAAAVGGIFIALAAGIGYLIYRMATAQTAMQKLGASMQQTEDRATGFQAFNEAALNVARLNQAVAQATQRQAALQAAMRATGMSNFVLAHASQAYSELIKGSHPIIAQQEQDLRNSAQAAAYLTHKTGSFAAALELGTQAGIKWDAGIGNMSAAAAENLIKVDNLLQGYKAMGQSTGVVGKDMTAIAIQAGLQSTQVQKLTQAWDAYMQLLTGGTSGLAGFELGLKNMTTGIARAKNNLSAFSGTMSLSVGQFASSLKHFTGEGAQAWQNFNQVVGSSAQQFIDWMDNAAAVGMVSGPQLSGAIKGIVAQMIPFAAKSATARAELAGLAQEANYTGGTSLKAMEHWARQGGMSTKQLGNFVGQTTRKLSDMAQVAANLGTVMQNSLVNMFSQARLKASGLTADLSTLSNAVSTTGTKSSTTHGDMMQVIGDMASLHVSVPTITALINSMGIHISQAGVAALIASGHLGTFAGSASSAGSAASMANTKVNDLAQAIAGLHSKTINIDVITTHQGIFIGGGGPRGISGHASGTSFAQPGLAMVGEQGRELIQMHGAERVFSNPETEAILGGGQHPGLAAEAGGGAGGGPQAIELHSHVYIDGKQVFESVKQHGLVYNTRNSGSRTGKYIPGP